MDDLPAEVKERVQQLEAFMKGHRGAIYTGKYLGRKVAVKVQRSDTDAVGTVDNEAEKLKVLNQHDIGPTLLFSGKDFMVYEFVEGEFILDYFEHCAREEMLDVLKDVMNQMFALDQLGINKEEMHHPVKHVVIRVHDRKPVLLDFERCKHNTKMKNVTQFCQFIVGGKMMPYMEKHQLGISQAKMLELAQKYKNERSKDNFNDIMELLR
ncbi:hypothetical protein JW968_04270 [Candidatus Woesearchaeota archaeon]|nr:hypothetical protein [Candidatus Woesearchaeota archaeon]